MTTVPIPSTKLERALNAGETPPRQRPSHGREAERRPHPISLWFFSSLILWATLLTAEARSSFTPSVYARFTEWKQACDRLPSNRALRGAFPPKNLLPLQRFRDFEETLEAFFQLCKTGDLRTEGAWLDGTPNAATFFNTEAAYFLKPAIPFEPFAQKLVLPPGSEALFHGDFHGDIHSLIHWLSWLNQEGTLEEFKIARDNTYMIFLGDYTDRGSHGMEVLYTIMRLKLENPDRVVLVRGNHEDVTLAAGYGFLAEGQTKYGREFNAQRVLRLYDFMPVVLYLGCENSFIQCNHGGMEPGFDPKPLLNTPSPLRFQKLGQLRQRQFFREHAHGSPVFDAQAKRLMESAFTDFLPQSPTVPSTLGFMWNDFSLLADQPQLVLDPGRAFVYGRGAARFILEAGSSGENQIRAVFRAHQHSSLLNPMMRRLIASRGVFRHWQETDNKNLLEAPPALLESRVERSESRPIPDYSVWTFNVSPDSVYGTGCGFDFDSFGVLTVQERFEDWRLRVVNLVNGRSEKLSK